MINEKKAKMYCCDDLSLIENYVDAVNSSEKYHCHHRKEDEGFSRDELKNMGMYFKRPAEELIFLTEKEHRILHSKGKHYALGKKLSEVTRSRMSESRIGGKNHKAKSVSQLNPQTGELIKVFDCIMDAERELGIDHKAISLCCRGIRQSAGSFGWKYTD